jgi:hypothetical protein
MGMKRRMILSIPLLIVFCAISVFYFSTREPSYRRKNLTEWVIQYHTNRWPLDKEAAAAIQHFGANAIPVLLEEMTRTGSPVKMKLLALAPKQLRAWFHLPTTNEYDQQVDAHRSAGASAFKALGEQARPAVPALIALLDSKQKRVRYLAVFSLRTLGPVARDALPQLLKCLNDPEFAVRDDAVMSMGAIHEQPELSIPATTNFLANNRHDSILARDAIDSLRAFGGPAKPTVPASLPFLNDKDPEIRNAAARALQEIDPEAAAKAGVK